MLKTANSIELAGVVVSGTYEAMTCDSGRLVCVINPRLIRYQSTTLWFMIQLDRILLLSQCQPFYFSLQQSLGCIEMKRMKVLLGVHVTKWSTRNVLLHILDWPKQHLAGWDCSASRKVTQPALSCQNPLTCRIEWVNEWSSCIFSYSATVCMNLALIVSIKTHSPVLIVLDLCLVLVPTDQVFAC